MSDERLVICGGASTRGTAPEGTLVLGRNITLKVPDIEKKFLAEIPPRLHDLLRIATYVYCADQATRRDTDAEKYGDDWRRRFRLRLRVQEPDFWASRGIQNELAETLAFLSDDEFRFEFEDASPRRGQAFLFGGSDRGGFQAEEVVLFSGGLDSLAGAIQESKGSGRRLALVSHWANPKIAARQKDLVRELHGRLPAPILHVPVQIQNAKRLGVEYTQRTRSFLYVTLAAVVARLFGLDRVRFFENGVVSINLPISGELIGARGTRTTHPRVLSGFSRILSTVMERDFQVENPFLWKTKTDVVRLIRDADLGNLIPRTLSCTRTGRQYRLARPHCGACSQCVDRRFATLAAGCTDDEEPSDQYRTDVLLEPRDPGDPRKVVVGYVEAARTFETMKFDEFHRRHPDVHQATGHIPGLARREAAQRIHDLHQRHGQEVMTVLRRETERHLRALVAHELPATCLLALALPKESPALARPAEEVLDPWLLLDEIPGGDSNPRIWGRISGRIYYEGTSISLGPRELFFVYELFRSVRAVPIYGNTCTFVEEPHLLYEFGKWTGMGYLSSRSKKPEYRLQENWTQFQTKMDETPLKGLFIKIPAAPLDGTMHFALKLHPSAKAVRITDFDGHLKKCYARYERAK